MSKPARTADVMGQAPFNGATPLARRGKDQKPFNGVDAYLASMGPRCCSVEKDQTDARPVDDAVASMGPRCYQRGKEGSGGGGMCAFLCFNGATPMMAWKTSADFTISPLAPQHQ